LRTPFAENADTQVLQPIAAERGFEASCSNTALESAHIKLVQFGAAQHVISSFPSLSLFVLAKRIKGRKPSLTDKQARTV